MLNMRWHAFPALLVAVALIMGGCGEPEAEWDGDPDRPAATMDDRQEVAQDDREEVAQDDRQEEAQDDRQEMAQEEHAPAVIPSGTRMDVTLESTLSTQESEIGDVFSTRVAADVTGANGEVLIPEGAEVRGQVVESHEATSPEEEAVLAISLEVLEVDGREYPIQASVTDVDLETSEADTPARSAITVATGAAAGAAVGQILGGDTRSTLQGLVAGAVAGTAVALATREGHAVLEEGSRMVVELDSAVSLEDGG